MGASAPRTVTFAHGKTYTLDEYGFLDPPEQWDEAFAEGMALLQGINGGLTDEHWRFIRYVRAKVLHEGTLPLLVVACAENHLRLSKLKALFPSGYLRGVCRIAGLSFRFLSDVNIWHTYETGTPLRPAHETTPQGFLRDFHRWNERFARRVAEEWDLPHGLTEKHWAVIRFLRRYYEEMADIPTIYEVCAAHDLDLDEFRELFPDGYRRGACRIAGLPFFA